MTKSQNSHRFISNRKNVLLDQTITLVEQENILTNHALFNRPTIPTKVRQYQGVIAANQWDSDAGNLIKFDKEGRLIDGRNRMTAFFNLGVPFKTDVYVGLSTTAILATDVGVVRKAAINPTLVNSIALGIVPTKQDFTTKSKQLSIARLMCSFEDEVAWKSPSSAQLELKYVEEQHVIDAVMVPGPSKWMKKPGARAAIAIYMKHYPTKAAEFFEKTFGLGAGLEKGSPILILRIKLADSSDGGSQTMRELRWTIYAIHMFHKNKSIHNLREQKTWEL